MGRADQNSSRKIVDQRHRAGSEQTVDGESTHPETGDGYKLSPQTRKEEMMLTKSVLISVIATATASLLLGTARADETPPNLAGTYRCEPQPAPCQSGQTFTVTQSGDQIEFKSDNGFVGHAKFTSRISLSGTPPWNSLGVITPDNHVQWSNGTQWRKM
jgi:hypothetical protein